MTVLQYILSVHNFGAGGFWSMDNPTKAASNSEIRIWMAKGCLSINGEVSRNPHEVIDYPLHRVVLFPKNALKRITLL